MRIEDRWGLDAGKTYAMYEFEVNPDLYKWGHVGDFTVVDGFLVAQDPSTAGLHYLSTLILIEPDAE